jgi:hypothetical protein
MLRAKMLNIEYPLANLTTPTSHKSSGGFIR